MIVCSLITISVVSAFGRLTREAMVVESVSTMMLEYKGACVSETSGLEHVKSCSNARNGMVQRGLGITRCSTYPSSIVSSKHRRIKSRFSRTDRFSSWFRRRRLAASVNDINAVRSISSFSAGSPII